MKMFPKYFFRGLVTLLPFGLTVFILVSFLLWVEESTRKVLTTISNDINIPGLGLVVGMVLICFLGFLTTLPLAEKVIDAMELPFKNMPIVKSIYSAIKSLSDYFSPESSNVNQQVVLVKLPWNDAEVMGLVTRKNLNDLPNEFAKDDRIAVFLPLSYQVGGLTVFLPRSQVRKVNMPVEVAMRSAITAWMPSYRLKD